MTLLTLHCHKNPLDMKEVEVQGVGVLLNYHSFVTVECCYVQFPKKPIKLPCPFYGAIYSITILSNAFAPMDISNTECSRGPGVGCKRWRQ
jgi:hypothetical protein